MRSRDAGRGAPAGCGASAGDRRAVPGSAGGLITGFAGTSREVPPPPALARAAAHLAGLVGKWDEGVAGKVLGAAPPQTKAERAASFAALRTAHGTCTVGAYTRKETTDELALGCERGGDLRLVVKLDEKDPEAVASFTITPRGSEGACPVK